MAFNKSQVAFASDFKYMRRKQTYTLPSGGGSINHDLGYIPFFLAVGYEVAASKYVSLKTGLLLFPSGDQPFLTISATTSQITIVESTPPINPTTYTIKVYEDQII